MFVRNLAKYISIAVVISIPISTNSFAQNEVGDLLDAPLSDLVNIEVTSVSKRSEKASEAAAAISVITNEDIRRSGFNSLPEVLRMVPGVQVSRINSGWWAITARGNASGFGNKLLVLIDGRSIYNPLFSGVLWEEQSTPLEDIERIEVIRGPGSTLYGANAVNGVINVITKNSKDTQGSLVAAGIGSYDKLSGLYRYGGKISDTDTYRAYVHNYQQGESEFMRGGDNHDGFEMSRGGFRYDGSGNNANYTLQGDVYNGDRDLPFVRVPAINSVGFTDRSDTHDLYGGNVIAKYGKKLDNGSDVDLQAYYDFTGRSADIYGHKIHTIDLDGQQTMDLSENHQFIWGLGYRYVYGDWDQSDIASYRQNDTVTTNLFSGFAQDKIQIVPDELFLTIGSKVEHNSFTGIEIQPNARVTWLPTQNQTVWGSVSRAVRTPSPTDRSLRQIVQGTPIGLVAVQGSNSFESEKLIAYEIGYRVQPASNLSFDVTGFVNDYDDLRTFERAGPIAPNIIASFNAANKANGITRGIEISSTWQVNKKLSFTGSYSYLDMDIKRASNSRDVIGVAEDGRSPNNMFNLRSHYTLGDEWEFDNALYYVDSIDGSRSDSHGVNDYIKFDARIGWKPSPGVEFSLVGQNLFEPAHQEFGSANYSYPAEIPRAFFIKSTFRF